MFKSLLVVALVVASASAGNRFTGQYFVDSTCSGEPLIISFTGSRCIGFPTGYIYVDLFEDNIYQKYCASADCVSQCSEVLSDSGECNDFGDAGSAIFVYESDEEFEEFSKDMIQMDISIDEDCGDPLYTYGFNPGKCLYSEAGSQTFKIDTENDNLIKQYVYTTLDCSGDADQNEITPDDCDQILPGVYFIARLPTSMTESFGSALLNVRVFASVLAVLLGVFLL